MNVTRAQEIVISAEKIQVEWNGEPVWIENVNAASKTANVHEEGNPSIRSTVSVEELHEMR